VPKDPPEKAKIKSDEAKEGSATYKVESKPLKIIAKLTGVVESKLQTPVSMDLDRWTELSIVSVLPHGTEVKKGDILFQLETKALEKKIRELEVGMPLKELDLETAKQELEKMGQTTPLQLEEADLAMRHADARALGARRS
jgi:CheY-specific phosphatase CheX